MEVFVGSSLGSLIYASPLTSLLGNIAIFLLVVFVVLFRILDEVLSDLITLCVPGVGLAAVFATPPALYKSDRFD